MPLKTVLRSPHCSVKAGRTCPWLVTCGLLPSLCRALQERDTSCQSTWSPGRGYWDQPIRTSLISFSPAWPWGALLQEGFKVLPFPWQSLWKQLVKLDDFKEQLLRIREEMNKCTSKSASHLLLSPDWHHMSWRSAVWPWYGWSRCHVLRLRFDKSWWAEPDGGENQALLFNWDCCGVGLGQLSETTLNFQMCKNRMGNTWDTVIYKTLKMEKPQTFLSSQRSLMYVLCRVLTRGDWKCSLVHRR